MSFAEPARGWEGPFRVRSGKTPRPGVRRILCRREGLAEARLIEGKPVFCEEFGRMLITYGGWDFKLEIYDKSEEIYQVGGYFRGVPGHRCWGPLFEGQWVFAGPFKERSRRQKAG